MNRLRQMSLFAHIVDAGSITSAAESLQLSKSVVSQHLKSLESELGIVLLKRTTRRQSLTVAGESFYQRCKELNNVADSAWLQAQETLEVVKGEVRITAPNALMETLVAPVIGELLQQHPLIEPVLISSDHHLDLVADNIDLAIRVGHSNESSLKQRRIGQFRDVLCAQPRVIASGNIEQAMYIANVWQSQHITHRFASHTLDSFVFTTRARCVANSFYTCLSLVQSGAGIGLVPDFYLNQLDGSLSNVFPQHQLPVNPIYALHPYNKHIPLTVKIVLAAIEQALLEKQVTS
ncbi:LysR family transcriptional regulator [Vibrio sp. MACH09]|uniref:LysR family transcriptional regulator n=1 Tax=Vibrio sp. MACH09 TaxID=3025122 RepID=UPI00295E32DE|nr:LysR family transcriptional regulator [Vibrio sp. MACH09]